MALPPGQDLVPANTWNPPVDAGDIESLKQGTAAACLPAGFSGDVYQMNLNTNYTLSAPNLRNNVLTLSGVAYVFDLDSIKQIYTHGPILLYNETPTKPSTWNELGTQCAEFTFLLTIPPSSPNTENGPSNVVSLRFSQDSTVYYTAITEARLGPPSINTSSTTAPSSSLPVESTSSSSPSDASSSSAANDSSSSKSKSTPTGTIALAVTIPLLVLGLAAAAFLYWRRRRRQHMAPSAAFRAAAGHRYADPDPPMMETREGHDTVSVAETELPGYGAGSSGGFGGAQPRGYMPGDEKRPFLGLRE